MEQFCLWLKDNFGCDLLFTHSCHGTFMRQINKMKFSSYQRNQGAILTINQLKIREPKFGVKIEIDKNGDAVRFTTRHAQHAKVVLLSTKDLKNKKTKNMMPVWQDVGMALLNVNNITFVNQDKDENWEYFHFKNLNNPEYKAQKMIRVPVAKSPTPEKQRGPSVNRYKRP